jgi:hypothetical protein
MARPLSSVIGMSPKVFTSYSWSTPAHEQWVLDFCSALRQAGIDVILDKWDLREGNDSHAFMEKMITDENIKKVMLICDKNYMEKANNRSGGVGTESQILTGELYKKIDQNKFVAILRERDENGNPYLPIYYGSKIYIDLSEDETYSENFEKVLRWIYDKPLYAKPELGPVPVYLSNEDKSPRMNVSAQFRRAVEALKHNRSYSSAAVKEYLDMFVSNLDKFSLNICSDKPDEEVIRSIEGFTPFRDEFIELIVSISSYNDTEENTESVKRFFENATQYFYRRAIAVEL